MAFFYDRSMDANYYNPSANDCVCALNFAWWKFKVQPIKYYNILYLRQSSTMAYGRNIGCVRFSKPLELGHFRRGKFQKPQ